MVLTNLMNILKIFVQILLKCSKYDTIWIWNIGRDDNLYINETIIIKQQYKYK